MKKYILTLSLLIPCLGLLSCKKFLEERARTEVIPKTAESLNELLLGEGYPKAAVSRWPSFLDDDKEQSIPYLGKKSTFYIFTWQPDPQFYLAGTDFGDSSWFYYYKFIQMCNVVLDYSEKVSGTPEEKDNVRGQARLLRALYYFKLVNFYAKPFTDSGSAPDLDLGVPLMLSSGVSTEGKPRSTVKEVYEQITKDLELGIEALERSKRNAGPYRMNNLAGYLLASRVYLHLGEWQKAVAAATVVLQSKFAVADLNAWGPGGQLNKCIVSVDNPETLWAFGNPTDVSFAGFDAGKYQLSAELLRLFEKGDLRTTIYIKGKDPLKRAPISSTALRVAHAFRISEALLNRAEAYARLNKAGDAGAGNLAINDLNSLRKKRFSPEYYADLVYSNADDLLQKCFAEKRREFFHEEEHRWFDLRRQGMPQISHYYYENATQRLRYDLLDHDPAYLLQIPPDAIKLNPKLTDNPKPAIRAGK